MVASAFRPTRHQLLSVVVPPIFVSIATIVVYFRFWARRQKKQRWGIDDYLCLGALILTWGDYVTLVLATVWGGYGIPQKQVPKENIAVVFQILSAFGECWAAAVAAVQISILCLYLRIFGIIRPFVFACYTLIAIVLMWWISYAIPLVTSCIPFTKVYQPSKPGKCIAVPVWNETILLVHIVLDGIILSMVLPVIWRMKTTVSNKVTVSVALLLGVCSTACAIIRAVETLGQRGNPDGTDARWIGAFMQLFENITAIICCSLPVMAFKFSELARGKFGSSISRLIGFGSGSGRSSLHSGSDRSPIHSPPKPGNLEHEVEPHSLA